MYVPVAQRNKPTTKTGYVPVAQRVAQQSVPKVSPKVTYTPKSTNVGVMDVVRELPTGARKVGTFLKELVAPSRGYTEQELKTAKPTARQLATSVPKVVAEFSSAIGNLLASSDRSLAYRFAQTALGGKLADVGAKIEEFGKPKNLGEAKAMRIADIVSAIPAGTMKVSLTGAQTIARTKNLKTIVGVLKKEIPDLSDEAAESFGRVFVNIDNADEIQKAVNKIDLSVSNARKGTSYTPVAQRQTPETIARQDFDASWKAAYGNRPSKIEAPSQLQQRKIAGKPNIDAPLTPKPIDPLLTEARKYKSAEEFVKAQGIKNQLVKNGVKVNSDNTVTLYHATSPENVVKINSEGVLKGGGTATGGMTGLDLGPSAFLGTDKKWVQETWGQGGKVIEIKVPVQDIRQPAQNFKEVYFEGGLKRGSDGVWRPAQTPRSTFYDRLAERDFADKSQLTDIWKKAQGAKQLPTPEGLPKLPRVADQASDAPADVLSRTPARIGTQPKGARKTPEALPEATGQSRRPDSYSQRQQAPESSESQSRSLPTDVSQTSRVVNDDISTPKLVDATYETNRSKTAQRRGRMERIKNWIKANASSDGLDKALGVISTRLKDIDPSLKKAIRDFEFTLAQNTQKDRKAVSPFIKALRSTDMRIEDYVDLDLALKNGDAAKTKEIIERYGLGEEFAVVRATLDDLYKRAGEVGYNIGYEKNYFPRMIEDAAGFLEYLQKGDDWSIIEEAIKAKETDLGRYLSVEEKANVINTLVRGYPTGKITLSETGAMKARRIDIVDADLNQFYRDSVESLIRYVDSTNDAIEARRFFGKGKTTDDFANIDDSIGAYILNLMADGKIKPSQEKELADILRARFAPKGTHGWWRIYKNVSYVDTMGSVTSAVTQLGDLAFALYKGGPVQTVKALTKAVLGKSDITRADIGIEKIAQEFQDATLSGRAVTKVFKLIGLEKMDALGKETLINASVGKLRKLANNPTPEFMRRLDAIFGDDADTLTRVIDDLKSGKMTEDTKLIAFNELLDIQPVALSEMPEQYLKGGNGRIFYMLKTYTIKLFDVYRNEVFQEMAAGRKIQGLKNLLYLTGALVAMNATADEIKDFILNRETSLKDRTVDNILKLAGFSKFTIYKAREEGIGSAVAKTILPPFKFIDSAYKDITQANEVSQLETIQSIPLAGKLYYWWFGKGATKTEKKRNKDRSTGGSGKLKTPPGLPELPSLKSSLPPLPSLPPLKQ